LGNPALIQATTSTKKSAQAKPYMPGPPGHHRYYLLFVNYEPLHRNDRLLEPAGWLPEPAYLKFPVSLFESLMPTPCNSRGIAKSRGLIRESEAPWETFEGISSAAPPLIARRIHSVASDPISSEIHRQTDQLTSCHEVSRLKTAQLPSPVLPSPSRFHPDSCWRPR
jgi:hypothetical protein